jgi:hypothetical protein
LLPPRHPPKPRLVGWKRRPPEEATFHADLKPLEAHAASPLQLSDRVIMLPTNVAPNTKPNPQRKERSATFRRPAAPANHQRNRNASKPWTIVLGSVQHTRTHGVDTIPGTDVDGECSDEANAPGNVVLVCDVILR